MLEGKTEKEKGLFAFRENTDTNRTEHYMLRNEKDSSEQMS